MAKGRLGLRGWALGYRGRESEVGCGGGRRKVVGRGLRWGCMREESLTLDEIW